MSAFLEACLSGLNYVFRTEQTRAVGVAQQPTTNITSPPFAFCCDDDDADDDKFPVAFHPNVYIQIASLGYVASVPEC